MTKSKIFEDPCTEERLSTKQLAYRYGVKVETVYDTNSKFGHYKGYEHCHKEGTKIMWKYVGQ